MSSGSGREFMRVFHKRFIEKLASDDSLHQFETETKALRLAESVLMIGRYPWEGSGEPRVLGRVSNIENDEDNDIPRFCFPHGCKARMHCFKDQDEMQSHIIGCVPEVNVMPFYFGQWKNPFLFCCYFEVSPLTLPCFSHSLELKDLLTKIGPTAVPFTTVCFAVKTNFPVDSLFADWFDWFLRCELTARVKLWSIVGDYFKTRETIDNSWLGEERARTMEACRYLFTQIPPEPQQTVEFENPPFPGFSWTRPECRVIESVSPNQTMSEAATLEKWYITELCLNRILQKLPVKDIITIYYSLLQERTFLIYSSNLQDLGYCFIMLHTVLFQLKWKCPSYPIIPDGMYDLIDSPTPFIAGVDKPLKTVPDSTVYINLVDGTIFTTDALPPLPRAIDRTKELTEHKDKKLSAEYILEQFYNISNTIINAIDLSSITNSSDPENIHSSFMAPLFKARMMDGGVEGKEFIENMMDSQMMAYTKEQRCRLKSDKERYVYKRPAPSASDTSDVSDKGHLYE